MLKTVSIRQFLHKRQNSYPKLKIKNHWCIDQSIYYLTIKYRFGALMCPNSILGAQVTPIPIRMSLNSILNFELTAYEPQFDTKYRVGAHFSSNSILGIELGDLKAPIWYLVSNWETYVSQFAPESSNSMLTIEFASICRQFDTQHRIGAIRWPNSMLSIELAHIYQPIR